MQNKKMHHMSSLPKKKNHMCNKPPVESDHSDCHLQDSESRGASSSSPHVLHWVRWREK
jgi:hypothetical protein